MHAERLPAKRGRDGTKEAGVPTAREQFLLQNVHLQAELANPYIAYFSLAGTYAP
jgi:hypothetical protein